MQVATMATEMLVPSLRALAACGPDVERGAQASGLAILAADGLPIASFAELDRRVPHETALALLDNAVRESGDPAFALKAGDGIRRGDLGLYDFITHSAPTLRDAILASARFLALVHDGASISLSEEGDTAVWRHQLRPGVARTQRADEYVMAAFHRGALSLIGMDVPSLEVRFRHPSPAHHDAYDTCFLGAPLRFERDHNEIVFLAGALDLPVVGADPALHEYLVRQGDHAMRAIGPRHLFTERVHRLVVAGIERGISASEVADLLHMSVSSLRRRLDEEGTAYSEVIDDVRRSHAVELLSRHELNVSEVASRLGFAHRPAFHRAFRRWFGESPSEYRAKTARSAFYRFYTGGDGA